MSSDVVGQAANILPPRSGKVVAVAVTATPGSTDLDALGWKDHFVTFQADGGDIYVLFATTSTVAAALDNTQTGADAKSCAVINNGTERAFRLRSGTDKVVGYKTATGTATLRMFVSSHVAGL